MLIADFWFKSNLQSYNKNENADVREAAKVESEAIRNNFLLLFLVGHIPTTNTIVPSRGNAPVE